MEDMVSKGRQARGTRLNRPDQRGELNPSAKISEHTAAEVLRLYFVERLAQAEIMRLTGVSRANVWAIVHRKSWAHLSAA